jgi:hypothetical protein
MPAAQPTPDFTLIAFIGQFLEQAPHSMQRSRLVILALPFLMPKTSCGHTLMHIPHPLQSSSFN